MNTALGVALSVIAGMILWAVPRVAVNIPMMGLRVFWVAIVVMLFITSKIPAPYNLSLMSILAGMAIFENLYHRYRVKAAARKAAKAAMEQSKKEARRARRKKESEKSDRPSPEKTD